MVILMDYHRQIVIRGHIWYSRSTGLSLILNTEDKCKTNLKAFPKFQGAWSLWPITIAVFNEFYRVGERALSPLLANLYRFPIMENMHGFVTVLPTLIFSFHHLCFMTAVVHYYFMLLPRCIVIKIVHMYTVKMQQPQTGKFCQDSCWQCSELRTHHTFYRASSHICYTRWMCVTCYCNDVWMCYILL